MQINKQLLLAGWGFVTSTTALAATQIPYVDEVLTGTERVEKLSIVGVLSLVVIVFAVAIVCMSRAIWKEGKDLIERGILAANNAAAAAGRMEASSAELREATLVLAQITANCGAHTGVVPVRPRHVGDPR